MEPWKNATRISGYDSLSISHVQGKEYATSEHLYQSRKYLYENAPEVALEYAELVRRASTPYKAKLLAQGKRPRRFQWQRELDDTAKAFESRGLAIDPEWNSNRLGVMREVLELKFEQDAHCREVLLSTTGHALAEHTPRDRFWGDGGDSGGGENHLGRLLVEVRDVMEKETKVRV